MGFNNPTDESSLLTSGFLNQLKGPDFDEYKGSFGKNSFRPRRDKVLEGNPLKNNDIIKSQIGK